MNQQTQKPPLLTDVLPVFAAELQQLLTERGEVEPAVQVPTLAVFDRCGCRDDICCGTFYTQPKPEGGYGPGQRNVRLMPSEGTLLILDVVSEQIMCVELLDPEDVRHKLEEILP